jgi:hypothetical protein
MKSRILYFVTIFEIISTIAPLGIIAPFAIASDTASPTPSPTSNHTPSGSCDSSCTCKTGCDAYNNVLQVIDDGKGACGDVQGKDDGYLAQHPVSVDQVMYNGTAGLKFSDCRSTQAQKYGPLGSYCAAKSLNEEARDFDEALAITWTVVTAVCIGACVSSFLPDPAAAVLIPACAAANVGATIADIVKTVQLKDDAQGKIMELSSIQGANNFGAVFGGAGAIASGAGALGSAQAEVVASCVVAGLASVAMSLKWVNYVGDMGRVDKECSNVNSVSWPTDTHFISPTNTPPPLSGGPNTHLNAGGGTSGIKNANDSGTAMANDITNNFPGSSFGAGAASAGPMGKLMDSLSNKQDIPKTLEKLGLSVAGIQQQLQNGTSPASALASAMNLPPEATDYMNKVQTLAANGQIQISGDASTMTGGGGGKGASGGSSGEPAFNPMAFFGGAKPEAKAQTNTMNFGAKTPVSTGDGSDIWHSGVKGSIFQIVSTKLVKSESRVEQLQWASPLNRALNGIPVQGTK